MIVGLYKFKNSKRLFGLRSPSPAGEGRGEAELIFQQWIF